MTTARERDPGWEEDAGQEDAGWARPSNQFWTNPGPINPPCTGVGFCASNPPGSACAGTGAWSQCSGVRNACFFQCAGTCAFTPRAVAEVCNGRDDDCDMAVDENPTALCDDGYDCSTDTCNGTSGCSNTIPPTCQEIRRPVSESRIAPDGVTWLMRRDNPRLTGRAIARVSYETFAPYAWPNRQRTMSPVASAIIGNGYANIEPGNPAAGWLYSENVENAPAAIGSFRAPQILLNLTGATEIALYRFPGSSGAYQYLDQIRMELDPDVLVVPVRATVFLPSVTTADTEWWRAAMGHVFEPAAVQSVSFSTTATSATAVSRQLSLGNPPDDIWTQCNIQFRLADTRVVPNPALAATVMNDCRCGNALGSMTARTPLGAYIDSVGGTNQSAIDIFIGDEILDTGPNCSAGMRAAACGPSIGCEGDPERTTVPSVQFRGIVAQRADVQYLAHELGHMLGLGHAYNDSHGVHTSATPCVSIDPNPANVMGSTDYDGSLVPAQCGLARCVAARWINLFTPSTAAAGREAALCAGY